MIFSSESELIISNNIDPIDGIQVKNKFAVFSTIPNDVIFGINKINKPIFCGGIIKQINRNVYGYKKNDFVAYLSQQKTEIINLSSNVVIKRNNMNKDIFAVLPYASYAMKILREIDPKIGQNIIIFGLNFFSILLLKIFKLAGSYPLIINIDDDSTNQKIKIKNDEWVIEGSNEAKIKLKNIKIDYIVICTHLTKEVDDFLKEITFSKKFLLKEISIYDKGIQDLNYIRGIKYPYSYVRWDFKHNLNFFISFFKKGKIMLDFLDYKLLEIDSIKEIPKIINDLQNKSLILFSVI